MATLQGDARMAMADDLIPPLAEAAAIGTDPALASTVRGRISFSCSRSFRPGTARCGATRRRR